MKTNNLVLFSAVVGFAFIAIVLLVFSFAANDNVSIESESASITGNARTTVDNTASANSFITFGSNNTTSLPLEFSRPAGWENWPRQQMGTGANNVTLNTSTVLVMPDQPVLNTMTITGNNANVSVVIIGGNIQINSRSDHGSARYAMRLRGTFNHVYLEGMLFDGIGQSDAVNSGAIIDTLTIQNTFFDRHYGGNGRNYRNYPIPGEDGLGDWYTYPDHDDTLQSWPNGSNKIKRLYLFNIVSGAEPPYGRGGTHGKFAQGIAPTVDAVLKNIDVVLVVGREPFGGGDTANTHHGGTTAPWWLDGNLNNGRCESVYVRPNYEHSKTYEGGPRYANPRGCQGGVTDGIRPGGPVITKDQVGLNYVQ